MRPDPPDSAPTSSRITRPHLRGARQDPCRLSHAVIECFLLAVECASTTAPRSGSKVTAPINAQCSGGTAWISSASTARCTKRATCSASSSPGSWLPGGDNYSDAGARNTRIELKNCSSSCPAITIAQKPLPLVNPRARKHFEQLKTQPPPSIQRPLACAKTAVCLKRG